MLPQVVDETLEVGAMVKVAVATAHGVGVSVVESDLHSDGDDVPEGEERAVVDTAPDFDGEAGGVDEGGLVIVGEDDEDRHRDADADVLGASDALLDDAEGDEVDARDALLDTLTVEEALGTRDDVPHTDGKGGGVAKGDNELQVEIDTRTDPETEPLPQTDGDGECVGL